MKPETIENIIDHQKTAYIASVDENGYPNLKAMLAPRKRSGLREFWFTTNTSSMRVAQYRKNHKASIYFCDQRFFRGVMLMGTMEVLEDVESKEIFLETELRLLLFRYLAICAKKELRPH
ncbi:MAG: pyridoxamine 5'-phosphate oxidase family protein [Chitinispirillales bacterium]|jgi:general stress protein 26|nr:pyridoxamine 5'-phosphate oxidase family protein [Chitinispirillales bacterium]